MNAEVLLSIMERFGYSLKKARKESAELLQLITYESWGYKKDEQEETAKAQAKYEHETEGGEYT